MHDPWNSYCKTVRTKWGMEAQDCGREGGEVGKISDAVTITEYFS